MKKSIFAIAAVLLFAACAKESPSSITSDSEDLVFYASVETPTKAVLNTTTYALEWASDDEIAIVDNEGVKVIYVATPDGEDASKATFTKKEGEVKSLGDGPYTAYYPASISEGLPNVTVYYNGDDSDLKSLPMAAHSETTSLEFKNLCSIIKLTLSAQSGYNFKSVTLSSESNYLSGPFTIESNQAVLASGKHYSTLNRANAKSMSADQVYYLPIPAGTYDDLQIMVYNNVKGEQSFYLNKTRSFDRNTIYPLTLNCTDFRENLSRTKTFDGSGSADDRYLVRSTANCYQATSGAGHYKFLPTKGEGGELVTGIKSAKVLWEAQASTTAPTVGTIVNATVKYNKGYIEFNAGGSQGNAVIAAYDGENGTGNILWSWHIWRANAAFADETYPHGEIMMDRNVGTFNNNRNTTNAVGVYFQYGRKDPFPGRGNNGNDLVAQAGTARTTAAGPVDIATSIKNPTVFYTNSSGNNWCTDADLASAVWDGESKTIYDPCPAGYRVPARSVWTTDGSTIGSFVDEFATYRGCTYDGKIYAATGQVGKGDGTMNSGVIITFMWTRELNASKNAYILDMRKDASAKFNGYARAQAIGLRCQKVTESESVIDLDPKEPVTYTADMRFTYTDQNRIAIYNLYSSSEEWSWKASDSPELSGYEAYFNNLCEVKAINGGDDLLVCSTSGGVAKIHIADKSIGFFALPMGQPHSIELLPDGNVVVATSVSYDQYGNMLKVYAMPSGGGSKRVEDCSSYIYNYSGHNVVWDSTNNVLWATSDNVINSYSYNSGTKALSLLNSYPLPTGNAHELSKVYGENALWVSTGSAIYKFNTSSHICTRLDGSYVSNIKSISSGPSTFPVLIVYPTSDSFSDSVIDLYGDSHLTKTGAQIYKARWII